MPCPICDSDAEVSGIGRTHDGLEARHVPCDRCGPFYVTEEALHDLQGWHKGDADLMARIAHGVRRMQREGRATLLTTQLVKRFVATPLPSVFEQANNLIRYLGEHAPGPGETVNVDARQDLFIFGAKSPDGVMYLIDHSYKSGLAQGVISPSLRSKAVVEEVRRDTHRTKAGREEGWADGGEGKKGAKEVVAPKARPVSMRSHDDLQQRRC
jgi:hypothetical protein